MNMHVWRSLALGLLAFGVLEIGHAQEPDPADRVARLSYLLGEVQVNTDDAEREWSEAVLNQPLTAGDELHTGPRARAELQLGTANIQLDADSQLSLQELSDDHLRLSITQGELTLFVRRLEQQDVIEIDTPNSTVSITAPGSYRIDVQATPLTRVQVREGRAQISGERQQFTLQGNEQLTLSGAEHLVAERETLTGTDEFDRWAAQRNQRGERVASINYVAPEVIGYEDLDGYGDWRWYADYGYVWSPRVRIGWAPYRDGYWRWVSPWGWTWVDTAPWGFAPFHYGRWASIRDRWCWVPGPRIARPVYAPALVAWLGTPGVGVAVNVGWVPLGPREVYRPLYRSSPDYVVRMNLGNSRLNRNEIERDMQRQPHDMRFANVAATSVLPARSLGHARPVNEQLLRPDMPLRAMTTLPQPRSMDRLRSPMPARPSGRDGDRWADRPQRYSERVPEPRFNNRDAYPSAPGREASPPALRPRNNIVPQPEFQPHTPLRPALPPPVNQRSREPGEPRSREERNPGINAPGRLGPPQEWGGRSLESYPSRSPRTEPQADRARPMMSPRPAPNNSDRGDRDRGADTQGERAWRGPSRDR